MRKLLAILSALLIAGPAHANFDVTTGSGTHIFAIDGSNQGTSLCAAASTECPASVPVNTAGTPLFTSGNPGNVALPAFLPGQTASGTSGSNIFANGLSTEQTVVTTGQVARLESDLAGKLVVSPYAQRELVVACSITITSSTSATPCTGMGAQGASVKIYVLSIHCTRNDTGTTAVTMTTNIKDTTGTNNIVFDLPANGGGGGDNWWSPVGVPLAANTGLTLTSGTSIASEHCDAEGIIGY